MAPKRPHTKSRLGCRTCKTRRVKCDELHPVCTNCARREIDCVWVQSPGASPSTPDVPHHSPRLFDLSLTPSTTAVSQALDLSTLELLHQYMTSTAGTLVTRTCAKDVLRAFVPKLALSNTHLMHAILSVAALHLHTLHVASPDQSAQYRATAAVHYRSSISSLNTESSPEALFLTNCILAFYEFASASSVYEPSALAPFGWLTLFRILRKNLSEFEASAARGAGPISNMLILAPVKPELYSPYPEFPTYLFTLPYPSADAPDPSELTNDPEAAHAYQDAIRVLKQAWAYFQDPETEVSALFMWPATVSDKFISLVTERRTRALVILAHYCAMLMLPRRGFWWIRRQGFDDFWKIQRMLDQRWRPWLEWPLAIASERDTSIF